MPISPDLLRELTTYALAKPGATHPPEKSQEEPEVRLAFVTGWNEFFNLRIDSDISDAGEVRETRRYLYLPVLKAALARHRKRYPAILLSSSLERDGHVYLEIPVESNLPVDFLKSLIDDAHAIIYGKLDDEGLRQLELSELPYDERSLIDHLIDLHGLAKYRREIHQLAKPAILLQTAKSDEEDIPLGPSKLGGRPDLPPATPWPKYRDGKPLAFLGQINLNEIARLPPPFAGLPKDGLLSIFSVWGWVDEESLDPPTPDDGTWKKQETSGWTVVLHTPSSADLQRRAQPDNVNSFPAALIEPKAMLSLPNHSVEPPLAALHWPVELLDRFDQMQGQYRSLQRHHWQRQGCAMQSAHQLGGYAFFQQQFPPELLKKDLAMVLQISSDAHAGMWWSDSGELTFYASPKSLAAGTFQRIWGTCQGG